MSGTVEESASTAERSPIQLGDPDATNATPYGSDTGDDHYWLTPRGWCEAMGISSAAQEALHVEGSTRVRRQAQPA